MVLGTAVCAETFVVRMRRVGEHFVDQKNSALWSQYTGDFGHAALEVNPVVHRVHRPDRIDSPIIDRYLLRSTVDNLDAGAATAEDAAHPKRPTYERRGLDGQHVGARPRGAHRSCTHPRTDVNYSFACLWVDQVDDRVVDR